MSVIDHVLAAALVLMLPAEALWTTLSPKPRPRRPLADRLVRSLRMVGALLLLLALIWWWEGRPVALLGLDLPVSTTGMIGIAVSITILGLLAATILLKQPAAPPAGQPGADMLPRTKRETRLFLVFALVIGFGWELLYRGFLLWALSPLMGMPAAVVVAATAYGLAHATRDVRSLVGAIVSAFAFTIAYALTGSLWWLIILHIGLPMIGLLAGRVSRAARR
ncbi:MAG TPA: CPBP family intramembrane glutamic endopeptidase [Allosphingosinicella sp.]